MNETNSPPRKEVAQVLKSTARTRSSEALLAASVLALVLLFAFESIVAGHRTLLTSNIVPGTLPSGAYGYKGNRVEIPPVLDAGASAWVYEPDVKVLRDDLTHGWLPLWNPYVGGGSPFLANMFSAALSPTRLVLAAVEKPFFWDMYLVCRLFLAGVLTFLFARRVGLGFTGSLIAGIIFSLSGHFILEVNMPDLDVQIWLPALLLVSDNLARKQSFKAFLVTALLVSAIILGGMPESALFAFVLSGLYFLFCLWSLRRVHSPRRFHAAKSVITLVAAGVVGLLISLPVVLPFLEYLQQGFNPRAPGVGSFHLNVDTAISLIAPRFFGELNQAWTGVSSLFMLPYLGGVCCLLALAGLSRKRPLPSVALFLAGAATLYLLNAFGIPPIHWVSQLPLFNMSIFPKHAFPEFALCLAILAGMGAESLLQSDFDHFSLAILSVLFCIFVAVFAAYYWKAAVHAGALRSIAKSCLILAADVSVLSLLTWAAHRFGPARLVALGLVILPSAELISFMPRDRVERYDAFTKPPFIDFLRADPEVYRTFSVDDFLYPDVNAAYGISDIRSLDPLQVRRYFEFLRKNVAREIYDRFDGTEPRRDFLQSTFLDLLNVKYVLASSDINNPDFISDMLRYSFILPTSHSGVSEIELPTGGRSKHVLVQHGLSRIDYETAVRDRMHLKVELASSPTSQGLKDGSGVVFRVDATDLSAAQQLFSEYIDPKNRIPDRKWHSHSIDLSPYRGQEVYLIFRTAPEAPNNYNDLAHWAQLPGGIQQSLRAKLTESQIITPFKEFVIPSDLTIDGQKFDTWFQHPPSTVRFRLRLPVNRPILNFATGLDPRVWAPEKGSGVHFEVWVAPVRTLFVRSIQPDNEPEDRDWHPADIDLSNLEGHQILLSFQSLPEAKNSFGWYGWRDLRLQREREKFDLVYDHEVKIYRNNDVLPRAFVVNRAEYLTDKGAVLGRLTQSDFHADKAVILEENTPSGSSSVNPTDAGPLAPVLFDSYEPNYIKMHSTLTQPGWIVLTDTYYPGWKVRVDGKPGRILPADYIFRAVPLEAGSHVVEFIYRPASFLLGLAISLVTIVVLLLAGFWLRLRNRSLTNRVPSTAQMQ